MTRLYLLGFFKPVAFYCFGGSAPKPKPAPPPPQLAKIPSAEAVKAETSNLNVAQGYGAQRSTLLTSAQGDVTGLDKIGKKTLLGG